MSSSEKTPLTPDDDSGKSKNMDKGNSHVWNELGNVYLNAGACDDAIAAYSKAIELDRNFAWPYSNLALAYVQKGRFAEAILLYQRSIELFSSDSDKAITWNRLGNVYRRMNDYDNAIASYLTADKLDPENATLSLRLNFGLVEETSSSSFSKELNTHIKDSNKAAGVLPNDNPSEERPKKVNLKTDSFLQETISGLRMFLRWIVSSFMDGVFVALWALIQYSFNLVIQNFPLQGVDVWVFRCFQFLFALTTIAPVVIYIYEDIMVMSYRTAKRVRFEKEQNHISE